MHNKEKRESPLSSEDPWYSDRRYALFWQHYNTMMMTAHRDAVIKAKYVATHTKAALSNLQGSFLHQNNHQEEQFHQIPLGQQLSSCSNRSLADIARANRNRRKRKRKRRNRRNKEHCDENNIGVLSDTEILHSQMSQGMHIQDADDEEDMDVAEDFLIFMEESEKHREQWKVTKARLKGLNGALTPEDSVVDTGPKEHPDTIRSREMQHLYGTSSPQIHAMETAIQLSFDRICTLYQPQYWPNIPINVMFN